MKKVKKIFNLINYNLKALVGFEALYKLLSLFIFMPLFLKMFNLITKTVGYNYLTLENFFSFLSNPLTIILLVLLFLFMTLFTIFDIATIIVILDASFQKKKIQVSQACLLSLEKCKGVFKLKNILVVFLVLFLIPFLNIGVSSSLITTIKIPEFIMDYIVKNRLLLSLMIILYLFFLSLLLRWLYIFHYHVIENKSFKEARKASITLSKKCHLKDLITLVVMQIVIFLIYLLFLIFGILLIVLISKLFAKVLIIKSLVTTIIWLFIAFTFIIFVILTTPFSYAIISILYYFHKEEKKEIVKHILIKNQKSEKSYKWFKKLAIGISIIAFVIGFLFTYGLYKGKYNLKIEYARTLEVTAHRGASVYYPENTLSAFEGAKKLGADWIELDVQETKDGQVIVIHDTNFKRTTGVDKNTWELEYNEVEKLDAGKFFAKKFAGEKIPLLEDVIDFAKENNIRLNIEIKPTGYEKALEKEVVDIIKQKAFTDNCVITSQVYDVLKKVKKYDKNIKTVYVMSLAYGDITSLKAADNFSVEAMSVTKKLVKTVHNEGKELYAWTVNTKDSIKDMIDLKVDNIITDNITLAKDVIYSSKTSNIISEYVKLINEIF